MGSQNLKQEDDMSDTEKDAIEECGGDTSKRNFLKTLGTGLGIAGLASVVGGQVFAQSSEKKGRYIVVITHGADDPNRAIFGLLMAMTAGDKGWGEVHVWMTLGGADLAHKKRTDKIESPIYKSFGNATQIMKKIKDKGGSFGVCPPCADFYGATGSDKHDFVDLAGGDWLMKNIQDAWVVYI
jgi:predicted peroxiredoxin